MMNEEGRMRPSDPVSKWISEVADIKLAALVDSVEENIGSIPVNWEVLPDYRLVSASRETFFLTPQGLLTAALVALFPRKQIVARQRTWKPRS